jgi:hypothetical protein
MNHTSDPIKELPSAVRLRREFDVEKLRADLARITGDSWGTQRTLADKGQEITATPSDWKCLPLRAPGGRAERTDPGGPGTDDFAPTPLVEHTPYLAEVLDSLPCPQRSVRLMSAAPGVRVPTHVDTPTGLDYGFLRLHVPIVTNDGAVLTIDGVDHRWQPGTFWYGDFSRPHSVSNTGDETRVHLVVDCQVTPELLTLFPESFAEAVPRSAVAFARPRVPLQQFELADFQCFTDVPPWFLRLDSPAEETGEDDLSGRVVEKDGRLVLEIAGESPIGLSCVGGSEFLLQGWTEERGVTLDLFGDTPQVTYFTRRGRVRKTVTRPARR